MVRTLLLGAILLTLTAEAQAQAQDLDAALAAFQAGRFDDAFDALEAVLREGGQTAEGLVQVHLHLGIIRALRGEEPRARSHFEVALALDPDLQTPPELNPELREHIERVRSARGGQPARVRASPAGPSNPGDDLDLRLEPVHSPANLVRTYVLDAETGTLERPVVLERASGLVRVPGAAWDRGGRLALRVEAFDAYGNRAIVEKVALETERRDETREAVAGAEPAPGRGVLANPWLWTGVGLVVAGAAVTAGVLLSSPDRRYEVGAPTGP